MGNYCILNGINSNELTGLLVSSLPPISKPLMRTQIETIDGRDGDIVTNLGYSAYDKKMEIGLYGDYDIDEIIAFFASEGTVTFSNEPDKYYHYTIVDQIDYERLIRYRKATVTFHCQPYKYDVTETEIDYTNTYTEDTVPYIYRANPHDANMMKLKKVVGGTIAWNQIMDGYSYTANSGGKTQNFPSGVQIVANHKMLMMAQTSGLITTTTDIYIFTRTNNTNYTVRLNLKKDRTSHGQIVVPTVGGTGGHANSNGDAWVYHNNADVDISDLMIIDLTLMFGSTIADYLYSLEQAHAGDGVAWFKALFGEDYYPYNAGELLSVKTSARKTYNADHVEIGSYALDNDLELRGIPKLDSNNELYYDGDTYASDGTVTRKYAVYTFTGNEEWTMYVAGGHNTFNSGNRFLTDGVPVSGSAIMDSGYIKSSITYIGGMADKSFQFFSNPSFSVTDDSYTSATDFAQHMAGRVLVYELATPTTESADAYTQSQRVGATEEFVDGRTVEIPVGNNTLYYDGTPEIVVTNAGNVISKPILTIYGSGDITVSLNSNQIFSIALGDYEYITIDTNAMEAYMGGVLLNRLVTGDYADFSLAVGDNTLSFTGDVSEVLIENYSRWI